ncbi:MAG: alpha/beta hydrolase [Pseudomonadales bacterium]
MDIYTPDSGVDRYPVIVMFHGGGWLINDKSIMDQAARYLATNSRYVVCNVNYRLLADDDNTVRLNQIVEDAFGAVLWVQENIARYQGDGTKIAVTGDSAGGHLSAMIVNMGNRLNSDGFAGEKPGFNPSYLPADTTAEELAQRGGISVQAAVLSYGAYDIYEGALGGLERVTNPFWLMSGSIARGIFGNEINAVDNPDLYRAVSPLYNIPDPSERQLPPQLLTAGSMDTLVTPASVKDYMNELQSAGHPVRYWEHEGRPHAFLDSGSNMMLGISFEADAPPALDIMISFLDELFYP